MIAWGTKQAVVGLFGGTQIKTNKEEFSADVIAWIVVVTARF